jgi:uncharacterized protein YbjT (DUF2867 family)
MILVVGATGNTGRETVPRLLERGIAVRALSRDPERARALPGFSGAEIVAGDPARPETLEPAMQGVTKVFLIPPSGPGSDTSEQNVIEAARRAGVRHIVKLSALCADPSAPSMALSHNYRAEEILKSSGVPYTILRPSSFMQNFLYYYSASIRGEGAVYQSLGEARMAIIDTRDIAEVAVKVLTSEGHEGKTYDLTGPEALTYAEAAEKLGAAIGRPVRYVDVPAAAYEQALVGFGLPPFVAAEVVNIYGRGPYREGKAGSISSSVADLLGRPARSFSEFARDHAAYFLP